VTVLVLWLVAWGTWGWYEAVRCRRKVDVWYEAYLRARARADAAEAPKQTAKGG
jgi:hypothetical protein